MGREYAKQDYAALADATWIRRLPIPVLNKWASIFFLRAEYKGAALRKWIGSMLALSVQCLPPSEILKAAGSTLRDGYYGELLDWNGTGPWRQLGLLCVCP
jgi:hypothetical protein